MGGKTKAVIFNLLLISAAQQLLRVSVGMVAAQAEELKLESPRMGSSSFMVLVTAEATSHWQLQQQQI